MVAASFISSWPHFFVVFVFKGLSLTLSTLITQCILNLIRTVCTFSVLANSPHQRFGLLKLRAQQTPLIHRSSWKSKAKVMISRFSTSEKQVNKENKNTFLSSHRALASKNSALLLGFVFPCVLVLASIGNACRVFNYYNGVYGNALTAIGRVGK